MSLLECKMMEENEHENVWTFIEKYSSDSTSSGITFHGDCRFVSRQVVLMLGSG